MPCVIQERLLNAIKEKNGVKHFNQRLVKCYGNYHFNMDGKYYTSDRYDCFNNVHKNLVDYESNMVSRNITWVNQTNYAFVLSPAGGGYDCHRTWEALILGSIPIVKRFNIPLEEVYEDLPVLIVDNWSDINEELLSKTLEKFKDRTFNYEKLTLDYWVKLIYSYKK
jgi:hypothetical protein